MYVWMDGWMHACMHACIHIYIYTYIYNDQGMEKLENLEFENGQGEVRELSLNFSSKSGKSRGVLFKYWY
jgi:uncharacterized membrane protein